MCPDAFFVTECAFISALKSTSRHSMRCCSYDNVGTVNEVLEVLNTKNSGLRLRSDIRLYPQLWWNDPSISRFGTISCL